MSYIRDLIDRFAVSRSRLGVRWSELCESWRDDRQRGFTSEFADPLTLESQLYADELNSLEEVIQRVDRMMV